MKLDDSKYFEKKFSTIKTTKNRLGQDCEYSTELAHDLREIHLIDIEKLFSEMYGTTFVIEKTNVLPLGASTLISFELKTNDERDEVLKWSLNV